MAVTGNAKLSRLYQFFDTYGTERLNGLDCSYFAGLDPAEREQAWDFLMGMFPESIDSIVGLHLLDKARAIEQFKMALDSPAPVSDYPAQRREIESNRASMLRYVTDGEGPRPDSRYVAMLGELARSEFGGVRAQFAYCLTIDNATPDTVEALKRMIFTETECVPLGAAITALMGLHGLAHDPFDPEHRSLYRALRSDKLEDKLAGMARLDAIRPIAGS